MSPSGKASDSDSDITGVRIPAPQPEKSTSVNRCAFFNEAHLRCMKNEARLRLMKRAFGSRRALRALRFTRAQRVLHGGNAAASYRRSRCFTKTASEYLSARHLIGAGWINPDSKRSLVFYRKIQLENKQMPNGCFRGFSRI